jgi:asparagine synthase (glutamine-hydrolysing)
MCGIWGWAGQNNAEAPQAFQTASRLLHHRGPDDQGIEQGSGWGLGFRRLSILDLSPAGHQPMCTQDGRYWIVFNGEIYNYIELRHGLEQRGEQFRSGSDTEVLLRLLAREGPGALLRLNGMFAFAWVDTLERKFFLARDRMGVKPLYYQLQAGRLRFASELKGLLAWPDASRTVNETALLQYLALNYLPAETCILAGYQKLLPGSYLQGDLDQPEQANLTRYWRVTLNPEWGDAEDGACSQNQLDELQALCADAVRIRLRSDVPLGVFLSGGIDSGLVAALAGQVTGEQPPLALTVTFSEKNFDESALAQATAAHSGLPHQAVSQIPAGLEALDHLAWFYDEPFGDSSALPTFTLCQAAAQHATVFLSGDGGDEAFGGYRRYIASQQYAWAGLFGGKLGWLARIFPPLSALRYRLEKMGLPDQGYAAAFDGLPNDPAWECLLPEKWQAVFEQAANPFWQRWAGSRGMSLLARQQQLDYDLYLPDDILVKMDRASMAHSIEVRSPFLDYRLVEWAARLPRRMLLNAQVGKLPLRRLAEHLLPANVCRAEKRGFGVPLETWFRSPTGDAFIRQRLLSSAALKRGWWKKDGIEQFLTAQRTAKGRALDGLLWRLLFLDAWARQYVDGDNYLHGPPVVA